MNSLLIDTKRDDALNHLVQVAAVIVLLSHDLGQEANHDQN